MKLGTTRTTGGGNAVVLGAGRWLLLGAFQGPWGCECSIGGMAVIVPYLPTASLGKIPERKFAGGEGGVCL